MAPESTPRNMADSHTAAVSAWSPLRFPLWVSSLIYEKAIALRNRRYDRGINVSRADVPVISIGNITCGGTGKTPMVVDIARRLLEMGHRPAVLARGYGAAPGMPNDEERLVRGRLPGIAYFADRDRVASARRAVTEANADCLVLDDGFQHRRLARDFDIVLIDATAPFGGGFLLPRGLLREPLASLRRAHLVIMTRVDQADEDEVRTVTESVRRVCPETPILAARHAVREFRDIAGMPVAAPANGTRAILVAAIGRPNAFETTAASLGIVIADRMWWPDHHQYSDENMKALLERARSIDHDVILTTEKDAVKLERLSAIDQWQGKPIRVVCIDMEYDRTADGAPSAEQVIADGLRGTFRPIETGRG